MKPVAVYSPIDEDNDMLIDVLNRIEQRLAELNLTASAASREAGLSPDAIRNMQRYVRQGKVNAGVNSNTITRLAPVLQVSAAWLMGEDDGGRQMSTPNASFPPRYHAFPDAPQIPLLGQSVSGPNGRFVLNGQTIDRVFCPPNLVGVEGAYAVRVYGTSMEPRYFAGETIWMNPHEPVRSNDFVVVQVIGDDEDEARDSYIKQFVSRSSKVVRLRQLNPDDGETEMLEFPADRVYSIHKIVFQASL